MQAFLFNMGSIIGKKVATIRGEYVDKVDKRIKHPKPTEPAYILFDDGETYIKFEEQDYYSFHDCSSAARYITVYKDEKSWKLIMNDKEHYPDANSDL